MFIFVSFSWLFHTLIYFLSTPNFTKISTSLTRMVEIDLNYSNFTYFSQLKLIEKQSKPWKIIEIKKKCCCNVCKATNKCVALFFVVSLVFLECRCKLYDYLTSTVNLCTVLLLTGERKNMANRQCYSHSRRCMTYCVNARTASIRRSFVYLKRSNTMPEQLYVCFYYTMMYLLRGYVQRSYYRALCILRLWNVKQ